ncbi:arylsulfatase B-like isoform X1 [Argiope bruennichi]|uniref:arylsulfatase B-like isoform X1 n=2 Tax=Argiope bruennichi TaxID=94029 RepID=UPI002495456F|nr:arylsulfatase B-like isoform X1 [Argiope bruennichi]
MGVSKRTALKRRKKDEQRRPLVSNEAIKEKTVAIMLFFGIFFSLAAVICYVIVVSTADKPVKSSKPHVIFVFADDLGWNDVSFHGSPQIPTPNLDALAASGILLNNYYVERLCSPSRAALLTGKYPMRLGLQHHVIRACERTALPVEEKIMPQYFKELGYATHLVGKWHLGYRKKEYTPAYRGFDSFFGYYNGYIDHYDYTHFTHSRTTFPKFFYGVDLHNATGEVKDVRGQYAADLFTEKAKNIIQNHDVSKPLFLYLAHLAVHTGNDQMPLQAPHDLVNQFGHIKNDSRRTFAGMVSGLDRSVGDVFQALHDKDMLSNSIFIFSSDNGGETNETIGGFSSNYPLRGKKYHVWEGGVRVPGFIWSPLFELQEPRVSMQLMHITDWLPTLYSAAGGDVERLGNIDGQSLWNTLLNNTQSPRQEILHNIDPIDNVSALRRGDFKLIFGKLPAGVETWTGRRVLEDMKQPESMDEWVFKNGSKTRDILLQIGSYLPKVPDKWRHGSEVRCKGGPETSNECKPAETPCLFNIAEDPCETTNVADLHPDVVQSMLDALIDYEKLVVKPQFQDPDPYGDPMCHGFTYVPWMDPEHTSDCPFR